MKIIGVIGWKNSGKTFYVQEIIKILRKKGYSVASIKHAHHEFDVDKPKTDSFLHRKAGSQQVIISSSKRWVKITELENSTEKNLTELIQQLSTTDIVIVEGFKNDNHPKIEIIKEITNENLYREFEVRYDKFNKDTEKEEETLKKQEINLLFNKTKNLCYI